MKKVTRISSARQFCHKAPNPRVLVATMGALHEGHAALFRRARRVAGSKGTVVVSIFVNPKQFAPTEDLSKYPRPLVADLALCQREKVDLVFHPSVEEMYAEDDSMKIEENQLSLGLCGRSRPGHFAGALTVIAKFFNILTPDVVIFGEKDWQQLALVRRLVRDFNYPIKVIGHPTVRESDHLALSSRNMYLSPEARALAPFIYQALQATAERVKQGETSVSKLIKATQRALVAIPHASIEYIEVVDEITLQPLTKLREGIVQARLLVAVRLGNTRLIDNKALPVSSQFSRKN